MNKVLIVDWSPVIYGNLFSATNTVKKDKNIKVSKVDGKYNLDEYKDIVIFKIIEELSMLRNKFDLSQDDEIVIATDTSTKEGYWRKDVWAGYKSKRKKARDDSDIQWDKAFDLFQEINDVLSRCSNFKVLSVPRTEGDDIVFVLSKYLSLKGKEVIIHSSDHDFIQCLEYDKVKFWRTTRSTGMDNSSFYKASATELEDIIMEHVIQGDPGDGFGNIKAYSRFSEDFLKIYPYMKNKELKAYPKRFQIEKQFEEKYDKPAYNHPRYGYKMFLRSKKTVEEIISENPIYELNYKMNRDLALPETIPSWVSKDIIEAYEKPSNKQDYRCLYDFLIENKLFEVTSSIPML